jgi:anti-sigma regulatory factor (Ser/Thr protein kinase)
VFGNTTEARIAVAALLSPTDRLQARLTPHPDGVRAARDLARTACRAWQLPHLLYDASLIASELAGNAIEHARTDFIVTVSRNDARLHVAVQDGATAFPRPRPSASLHERGRGLLLVHALAFAWGAMPARGGKVVWATLM